MAYRSLGMSRDKSGNLTLKAAEAYEDLCKKQEVNLQNLSPENLDRENRAFTRWEHVSTLEEGFFKTEI